ncbi:hypothetical protein PQR75_46885 [Paraburkholderia fungorum]|uniref:hypothetical protein n=1 Tax=Paraburkholderia fungorum TaxID=134537 RepID=UPI0038B9D6E7
MPDIVSSIQLSLDLVKRLKDLNEKLKDADIKMLLADLQSELADAKLEVVGLKEKMADLMTKNVELSAKLEARTSEQPEPMRGGYQFGGKGPYCLKCFETAGKKLLLPLSVGIHTTFGQYFCPVCGNHS